jgi:hypothetical protein
MLHRKVRKTYATVDKKIELDSEESLEDLMIDFKKILKSTTTCIASFVNTNISLEFIDFLSDLTFCL